MHAQVDHAVDRHVGARVLEALALDALDLVVGEPVARHDLDRRLARAALLDRGDREHAVLVDGERDLDLRDARGHRRDAAQVEGAERAAVLRQLALALQHVDAHAGLSVLRCRELLVRARGHRAVAHDELRHRAADGLDAERERDHVEQQEVAPPARDDRGLHRRAERDDAVGIERRVGLLREEARHRRAHAREPRRAAHEHHPVDLGHRRLRVAQSAGARIERARDQRRADLVELGAREGERADARRHDRLDAHRVRLRQRDLCALGRLDERRAVVVAADQRRIGLDPAARDGAVDVIAAERGVTRGREHLEAVGAGARVLAGHDVEHGDVEGPAAEVVDRDALGTPGLPEPVGKRGRGRLVDDAHGLEACEPRGVARRLPLRVVEVGGHGDDRAAHRGAEIGLGHGAQLAEHLGRDLVRRDDAPRDRERGDAARPLDDGHRERPRELRGLARGTPHEALRARDRLRRERTASAARGVAHRHHAVGMEAHDRGDDRSPAAAAEHARTRLEAVRHQRIGRAEVDADDRIVRNGGAVAVGRCGGRGHRGADGRA